VSGHHAEIRRARGAYFIRDLGSTNGTFLNGQRIESEQPLHPGDEVRFGAARFAMVAGAKRPSSVAKIVGSALGLILIAAIGFLSFQFVQLGKPRAARLDLAAARRVGCRQCDDSRRAIVSFE
jgi:hypothetical protein